MRILITGGTGSLGNYLVPYLNNSNYKTAIYSRDEYKQSIMKGEHQNLSYFIGDVRDYKRLKEVVLEFNPDIIIHAAAMKRIEICEEHPYEAVLTDIQGGKNVVDICKEFNKKAIAISTDKAVKPVNVYGMCKAIQERIFTNAGFNCVRYGNVVGSRGSVIPLFRKLAKEKKPLTVTNPKMTRFLLLLENAVELIFEAIKSDNSGAIFVRKSSSATVEDIARLFSDKITIIGERKGEKIHEVLVSEEEMGRTTETEKFYIIGKNIVNVTHKEYTSENTERLSKETLKELLKDWLKDGQEI
jgi:UDP-N-acetylglucosamine 4,6-dehydratase/5-epimerase